MGPRFGALLCLAAGLALPVHGAAEPGKARRRARPVVEMRAGPEAATRAAVVALGPPEPGAVLVRAGTFTMGSAESEVMFALDLCRAEAAGDVCREEEFSDELAPHEVYLSAYWIDRTEVTVARYERCVAAGRCGPVPLSGGGERFLGPDLPITMVTWNDAAAFCAWSAGRLPTEAEWERAARGATGRRFPWGNVWSPFLANHGRLGWEQLDGRDGALELAPVGSYLDGRTPDGIADLAGNVEEWVADLYAPEHPRASAVNPTGPSTGDMRVLRGGSYLRARPWLRGAARDYDLAAMRRPWRGFRCAKSELG